MVRMMIRHRVADYEGWRRSYDDFDAERRGMGVTGDAVFQAVDDPNDVTVWHDFDSAESARSFSGSSRLREVMADAGVEGVPDIWYVNKAG
jgi:hypothetical protein